MRYRWAAPAAAIVVLAAAVVIIGGCAKKNPPVARPMPPPPEASPVTPAPPAPRPPEPVVETPVVPAEPVKEESLSERSLDELNRDSPLKPLFFELDSAEVSAAGQAVLNENAGVMKKYPTWVVTIEGHCDERGTAEYNLALGERRAVAARAYLVSLGVPAERVRTVSYGKEFPFDPAHNEAAWAKNRRAHFVITAK